MNNKYNPSFNIRYPEIKVKHDDEVANTFFSFVISGDVNKLNQYIIQNSIPINIKKEKDEKNALHLAVESSLPITNKLNMINFLLINYIPVNERDLQGNTPILIASKNNELDIVKLLLERNADPSAKNMFGINSLHYAAGGTLGSCKDIKIESIIEEPNSKEFNDLEINELSLAVKDLYSMLLSEYGDLGNVELVSNNFPYSKRINDYLAHMKFIFSNIDKYPDFAPLIKAANDNVLSEYKRILNIKNKNPNQLREEIVDVRNKYVDKYLELIEKIEDKPFSPIDMQSMEQIGEEDTGLFLQDNTGNNVNYKDYYKIDGSHETLDQMITKKYEQIENSIQGNIQQIENSSKLYQININSKSDSTDLIFQIINFGQQMQKLEIFQNIERLRHYGKDANIHHPYKQIYNGTNNVNIFEAYKTLLSDTDAATNQNFGIPQLNQTDGIAMKPYKVKADVTATAGFDLNTFVDVMTNPTNIYDQNILNTFTYDDYKPFTDEKRNSKTIEINFRFPVSMLFSDSNNKPGISGVATALNTYWDNGNKQIFSLRKGNNWDFDPSNGCHNVNKIKLEYKNLTDVKITLTYLISIGGVGGSLVEKTVSSDFIRDVSIVFLRRTNGRVNPLAGVNPTAPWDFNGLGNINNILSSTGVIQTTLNLNNLGQSKDSIKLSFDTTGGNNVYGGAQNMYNPLYAFHKDINDKYIAGLQQHINAIKNFTLENPITLSAYDTLLTNTIQLIKILYKFHTRYLNMLPVYVENVLSQRYSAIDQIVNRLQSEYTGSDLLSDMVGSIESAIWNPNLLIEIINNNLMQLDASVKSIIEDIRQINGLNIIAHYWHSDANLIKINRTLDDKFKSDFTLIKDDYNSSADEDVFIGSPSIKDTTPSSDVKYQVKRDISKVRGIKFFTLDTGEQYRFISPTFRPLSDNIINKYSKVTRFRILEELLLYIYHNRNKPDDNLKKKIKEVYDKVTDSIKDNFGVTKPEILIPLVLSVIGDFLDIRLINDVKKQFLEVANESFLKLIQSAIYEGQITIDAAEKFKFTIAASSTSWISDGHPKSDVIYSLYYPSSNFIGSMTTTNENRETVIKFTLDDDNINLDNLGIGTNNITIKLETEDISSPITFRTTIIDPLALDMDVPFELDLNSIDQNVKDTIKKKIVYINSSLIQILNKGDKLVIDPEFKYYEHISDNNSAKDQQIYYSPGFLDNTSENMCIKYNNDLLLAILEKYPDINVSDIYGNTPLLYAIKTNNYLAIASLLKNNARVLFRNNDGVTPLNYALDKLKNICGYFPDDNLITSINKSYIIGLKDELEKIDSSHNIMKNYDKLVELYLFLYNSMAYTNLYANNYNLLMKFIELSKDELANTFMKEDSYKYPLLLVNPLYKFIEQNEKIQDSLKSRSYVKQNVPSVLLANKALLEEENKKLAKDFNKLTEKIDKSEEYKALVDGNYQSNITEKIKKLKAERKAIKKKLDANKILIKNIEDKINTYKNLLENDSVDGLSLKFRNMPKQTKDLLNQNIIVSQLFQDENLSYEDSKIYLSVLDEMLKNDKYGMSAYNIHSHLNKQMKNFVEEMETYLEGKSYTTAALREKKEKCGKIKELVKETLSNHIFSKKSLSRKIAKNENLKDIFNLICFTIDQVVGYSFYKVLFRLIMTYFSKILPKGSTDDKEYIKFIGEKTKTILETSAGQKLSVKNIILPTYSNISIPSNFEYTPSYLTKRMVSTICGIKLPEEYSEDDNDSTFNLIFNLISSNNVMPIDSKSKIIRYLSDKIGPYFKKYYTISIKTLNNLTSNYENMIQNQYVLLKIIDKLLSVTNDDYQLQIL